MIFSTRSVMVLSGMALIGFAVGFGVGRETRKNSAEHVETSFENGEFTLTADVSGAVGDGIKDYFRELV